MADMWKRILRVAREISKLFFTQLKTQGIALHNEEDVIKMVMIISFRLTSLPVP
jgi:hypothetical protein